MVTIYDFKLGRQDEVRIGVSASSGSSVSRDEFNRLKKLKLNQLSELETRDGMVYVAAGDGQKMPAIPDVEPARNSSTSIAQYMGMTLEGESRDGRTKQKQAFPLQSVWRMFVLRPTLTESEALYRHAEQEQTVGQWTFFLGKVPSHKVKEAGEGLSQSTIGCIERAMTRFQGGEFGAIEEAKDHGQKLVAMSGGTGPASERLAVIRADEQQVRDLIRTGMDLVKEQKWDEALSAWESITKYLKDPMLKDFGAAHADTVIRSHDSHVGAANAAVQGVGAKGLTYEPGSDAPYRKALQEYEKALALRPTSAPALEGRRVMTINVALIEARRFRMAKDPGSARDVLLKTGKEHGEDARLSAELTEASCELSAQLVTEARAVATTRTAATKAAMQKGAPAATYKVRTIVTPKEKLAFTGALEKVKQAVDFCQSEERVTLLSGMNVAFADFHVARAKRAMTRKLHATALLHLNAARSYQSDRADLDAMQTEVREPVQQRAQIQVGVAINSINNECAEAAQQVAGAVESALVEGGSANIQLLARDQAQTVLRQMRSGSATAQANHAVVSGQISACTLNVTSQRRQVPSKLQFRNERYEQLNRAEQEANDRYNQCRRGNTELACAQLKNTRDQYRSARSRENPIILRDYTYEEQPFTATGQLRLTLQIDDTILRGTRPVGEASGTISDTCVARRGVQDNDWGQNARTATNDAAPARSGWRGFVSGLAQSITTPQQRQIPENVECPDLPRASRIFEMAEQLTSQAQTQAATAIRNVARNYLELAKRATDVDVALENYITFALLTADKSGPEFQQALTAIRARDADLNPEGALR